MRQRHSVTWNSDEDPQPLVGSVVRPHALGALLALVASTLSACSPGNRIARRIHRRNRDIGQRLRSVHTGVGVALLELERDVHEAHLRFALNGL